MHKRSITYGSRKLQSAQAVIEFALILPAMLILVLGGIDFGRALLYGVAVQEGAREAARFGTTAAVDSSVTDIDVFNRLIAASAPALSGCAAITTANQSCGGGTWTLNISVLTPTHGTFSSIAAAKLDSQFPGSQLTVTATGSVSMLAGFRTGWGLSLSPIMARGQAVMVVE